MKECGVLWKGKSVTYREVLKLGDSTKVNKGEREREREREILVESSRRCSVLPNILPLKH